MALDLSQATVGLYAPIPTRTHSLTETSSIKAVNWIWIGLSSLPSATPQAQYMSSVTIYSFQ